MRKHRRKVENAIRDVQAGYPFPDIIEETRDTVKALATVLLDLAPAGGRVLDIGCGALDKAAVYQRLGYQCYGSDDFQDPWHSRPENLSLVVDFVRSLGVEVHVQEGAVTMPWEAASFDVATIINVIEHLHESPRNILNFAGDCLKPQGLLVVAMPNSANLRKRLAVLMGGSNYTPVRGFYEFIGPWRGHIREYTLRETVQIIRWNGFEIVYTSTFHGMLRSRLTNPIMRKLFVGLCVAFPRWRDSLLVVARRPANWVPRQPDPAEMDATFGWSIHG